MRLEAPDSYDYHPDYQNNLRWVNSWLKMYESDFPTPLRVTITSSEQFFKSVVMFMIRFPDAIDKGRYATPISLNQSTQEACEKIKKVYEASLKFIAGKVEGRENLLIPKPPVTFDNAPRSMKEAMGVLEQKFSFKKAS